MFRPVLLAPTQSSRQRWQWQEAGARLIAPLTLWICVSVTLRYGYYGDRQMVLGPSSSRLVTTSSIFVDQIEARDEDKKGVFLYGFTEKPELKSEFNWTISEYVIVGSYGKQGFSLWLNKGSRVQMTWEAERSSLNNLEMVIVKGEKKQETMMSTTSVDSGVPKDLSIDREAEYTIEEDDKYYVGFMNNNRRSVIMALNVNITSKMYDISKAKRRCSTISGSCRLQLLFPSTQFVILTTPNNGDISGWYVEISFVARMVTYIAILGFVVIIIYLILKYLGVCDGERNYHNVVEPSVQVQLNQVTETEPLVPEKPFSFTYGTGEEDKESGMSSSSSEDLYDGKICVICYDEPRNSFFVPCGHCATCYDCAQRIMDEENKVCPICRRYIHKIRKLITS
ncbi:protein of unknown function DUF4793 [Dillenia turbinata]|uniref:RING-type domain-containing protein n=1 Tax=Dillenia turbinata TaxID=194707 RepID=A0AAN8ZMR2_9MAGN